MPSTPRPFPAPARGPCRPAPNRIAKLRRRCEVLRACVEPLERRSLLSAVDFLGIDSGLQGDWHKSFGAEGFVIPSVASELPAFTTLDVSGAGPYVWSPDTPEKKAQARPDGTGRTASTWYGTAPVVDLNLGDGLSHQVAFYLLDWEPQNRSQRLDVRDAANGQLVDTRVLPGFAGGTYVVYQITGHVTLDLTVLNGPNAVLGGVFFGGARSATPNAAPLLGDVTTSLPSITEDDTESPGTTVASLLAQAGASDPDPDALRGVAVTGFDNTHGTWQYSTGADTWLPIPVASESSAFLFAQAPANRIRFLPAPEYHGPATLTYRAWDRTIGVSTGPGNTAANGGATAYSAAVATATVNVVEINDAPALPGMNSLVAQLGQRFQFVLPAASDPDSASLIYSVTGLPPGMTFDPATRTITWTPWTIPAGTPGTPQKAPVPLKLNGWNYDAVTENSAAPFAQTFDGPSNSFVSWFESGVEGHLDGLPAGAGPFTSQVVNSVTGGNTTFALQPYDRRNVLILKDFEANTRALFLDRPMRLSSLAVLASSNRVGNFFGANVGFLRVEFYADGDTGAVISTDGHFPLPGGIGDPDRTNAARYDASTWYTNHVYPGGEVQRPSAVGDLGHNGDIGGDGTAFTYNRDDPVGMYETDLSLVNGFKVNGVVTDISDKYIKAIYFRKADSAPGGTTGIFALSGDPTTATPPGFVDVTYSVSDGQNVVTKTVRVRVTGDPGGIQPVTASAQFLREAQHKLTYTFDHDVSDTLGPEDLVLRNVTTGDTIPATVTYNTTSNTATFTFPGLPGERLPAGRYRATLLAAGIGNGTYRLDGNADGTPGDDLTYDFFHLPGDLNLDAAVNFTDFQNFETKMGKASGATWSDGDFNYDGKVSNADFLILYASFGTTLAPAPPLPAPIVPTNPATGSDVLNRDRDTVTRSRGGGAAAAVFRPAPKPRLATRAGDSKI